MNQSSVIRYDGVGWEGVSTLAYKPEAALFHGVTRRVLAAPERASFELRYFEMEPGGYSTHEQHEHVHVVLCLRGRGQVRVHDDVHAIGFGDVVQIAPGEPHQFLNPHDEPFGFLCVVDRERDRPVPVGG